MRCKQPFWRVATVTGSLVLGSALAISADEEQMFHVGQKGAVTFPTEQKVGALTLAPGRYEFQHRVMDSEHFVRFTRVGPGGFVEARTDVWRGPKQVVAEVQRRLEPLEAKATRTAVYSIGERITKVEVRGEDAVHRILDP